MHQLDTLMSAVATLTDEVQDLKHQVGDMQKAVEETREGVEFIRAVKTGGKLIKWSAVTLAALGFLWASVKGLLTQVIIYFTVR